MRLPARAQCWNILLNEAALKVIGGGETNIPVKFWTEATLHLLRWMGSCLLGRNLNDNEFLFSFGFFLVILFHKCSRSHAAPAYFMEIFIIVCAFSSCSGWNKSPQFRGLQQHKFITHGSGGRKFTVGPHGLLLEGGGGEPCPASSTFWRRPPSLATGLSLGLQSNRVPFPPSLASAPVTASSLSDLPAPFSADHLPSQDP